MCVIAGVESGWEVVPESSEGDGGDPDADIWALKATYSPGQRREEMVRSDGMVMLVLPVEARESEPVELAPDCRRSTSVARDADGRKI